MSAKSAASALQAATSARVSSRLITWGLWSPSGGGSALANGFGASSSLAHHAKDGRALRQRIATACGVRAPRGRHGGSGT